MLPIEKQSSVFTSLTQILNQFKDFLKASWSVSVNKDMFALRNEQMLHDNCYLLPICGPKRSASFLQYVRYIYDTCNKCCATKWQWVVVCVNLGVCRGEKTKYARNTVFQNLEKVKKVANSLQGNSIREGTVIFTPFWILYYRKVWSRHSTRHGFLLFLSSVKFCSCSEESILQTHQYYKNSKLVTTICTQRNGD